MNRFTPSPLIEINHRCMENSVAHQDSLSNLVPDEAPGCNVAEPDTKLPVPAVAQGIVLIFIVTLVGAAFFMFVDQVLQDGDTGWHLATGRYIVDTLSVPSTDPFSFSSKGKPWTAHEWLTEVLMHYAYILGGWPGVVTLFGLSFGLTLGIASFHAHRWMTPICATAVALLLFFGLMNFLLARPHVLGWPLLTIWLIALVNARQYHKVPAPGWAVMMWLWANIHGSFAIGLFLAAALGLEALIGAEARQRWHIIRGWGLFGLICLLASIATPSGIEGLYFPIWVSTMKTLTLIGEWKPTSFDHVSFFAMTLYLGIFACLIRPVRITVIRALLIVFLLHMALSHIRHQAVFLIVTSIILAEPLARAYRPDASLPNISIIEELRARWRIYAPLLLVIAAAFLGLIATRLATRLERPEGPGNPAAALSKLPPALRTQHVFNEYSYGGALIREGIPVFIDGRADIYGDKGVQDYHDIVHKPDIAKWRTADHKWQFRWTILPVKLPLVHWLDKQPEWQRIYTGEKTVIHVRRTLLVPQNSAPSPDQIRTRER